MKKHMRIWTFLLVMLMSLTLLTAQAESELPEEVADLFTVKAWAHYAIANQPDMPENKAFAVMQEESGYEAALLVMRNTKSETNVLVLAEKSSAQADWKITMRNWGAVGQGDANVPQLAAIADGRFAIYYPNGDSAYFAHEANGWQLTNLSFGDTTQVEVTRSGMTILIVTHEMHFARDVADRIMFMDGGVVVEEGPAKQLIEHPQEERTKQFLAHYSE